VPYSQLSSVAVLQGEATETVGTTELDERFVESTELDELFFSSELLDLPSLLLLDVFTALELDGDLSLLLESLALLELDFAFALDDDFFSESGRTALVNESSTAQSPFLQT
jgi:hypothetical protein